MQLIKELKHEKDSPHSKAIHEYISEVIGIFTTGDEELDMANIEIIVESLHALSNQNVDELKAAILDCRSRYFLLISEGKSH